MVKHARFQDFIWCFKLCFLKIVIYFKSLSKNVSCKQAFNITFFVRQK